MQVLTVTDLVVRRKLQRDKAEPLVPLQYMDVEYSKQLQRLIDRERELLAALGFILHVEHPQRFLLKFAKLLDLDSTITQCAWNFLMDSLRLNIHVVFSGNAIATACLYLAFRKLGQVNIYMS